MGVPICRALSEHGVKIAPSTCYAAKTRPVSARADRERRLLAVIEAIYHHGSSLQTLEGSGCAARPLDPITTPPREVAMDNDTRAEPADRLPVRSKTRRPERQWRA